MTEEESESRIASKITLILCIIGVIMLVAIVILEVGKSPKYTEIEFEPFLQTEEISSSSLSTEENFEHESESSESSSSESEPEVEFPIDINKAASEELEAIPGIGPSTAKLIIDYRNEHGVILSIDELESISGIGEKTIGLLKEYCIII